MRQGSVRRQGTVPRPRSAGELGWDESLYEDESEGEGENSGTGDGDGDGQQRSGGRNDTGTTRPRKGRRALRWFAIVLAVLILGTAAAGYLYYEHLNGNIDTSPMPEGNRAPEATPNAAGQTPLNILLIGSDARNSAENQKLGGAKETFDGTPLADVQMLLHLSADRSNMSVISMPRDTLLQMPECTDPHSGKVYPATQGRVMTNTSLGRGGPGCTVLAWEKLTNIHIDHFMMVDFAGVVSMADAIGGVPVCVDANIHSRNSKGAGSGLKLEKGTTYIQGEQALQWLRTRYGFEDGSDIGRAKAQHMYMNAMVRELRENATLSSPGKLRRLAEEATSALEVDEGLDTVKKLYDLSNELKRVPPQRITMTTMPYEYVGARVQPKPGDAEQLFRLVRDDVALDGKDSEAKKKDQEKKREESDSDDPAAEPGEIGVQVVNGTATPTTASVPGRASALVALLQGKGYARAAADQSQLPRQERTVIRFPSAELEGDARAVAESLGLPPSSVEESKEVTGVTLVVGSDWRTGDVPPKPEEQDDRTPESADAMNGADDKACMHVNPNFTW
ncbi:LCP family protein [Streptomyces sp. LHD-70]|uniref:LCP family protein n=1 Tax=Streptomyces sp. LHD-70 TaxID=3072140 RepID=UPI00280DD5AA|nr:LCP family protein [Streptomyces sp. LHD-70]MDQ8707456.1 LCP family protein [Streptomyces sp. LHD-70]